MASLNWRNGRGIRHIERTLVRRRDQLRDELTDALEESTELGARLTRDYLEAAVTRTGLQRVENAANPSMALGGDPSTAFPGRHVTGNMVGAVDSQVRNPHAREVTGVFGWWGQNYEDYFRDQDLGTGNIPPARSLPMAYVQALEDFRERVRRIANG